MQREDRVPESSVGAIVAAAFTGAALVSEAYSEFESLTRHFRSADELLAHVMEARAQGRKYFGVVVHYEGTGGKVSTNRFALVPEKCQGARWREKTEGWGLVSLQLTYQDDQYVKASISANSEKRARAWEQTLEATLGPVEAWNWVLVERHCRRLIRRLRSEA
jgi:hypothetical protein